MENEKQVKKPKIFLVLKILASILIVAGIVLIIVGAVAASNGGFDGQTPRFGFIFGGVAVTFVGLSMLLTAFAPSIHKINIKTQKYIIDQNKEDLQDISTQNAEIVSPGVTKVAKAVKEEVEEKKFCPECGTKIAADAKFCSNCGKKQ